MVPLVDGPGDQRMERQRDREEEEEEGGAGGCGGAAILVQDTAVLVDVVKSSSRALPRAKARLGLASGAPLCLQCPFVLVAVQC